MYHFDKYIVKSLYYHIDVKIKMFKTVIRLDVFACKTKQIALTQTHLRTAKPLNDLYIK